MDRHAALIFLAVVGVAAAKKPPSTTKKAPALHVRSIDLARRFVLIELAGVSKPPAPNLYRFTDERGRHFVAMSASCDPPFPSGIRACELEIPEGYERHKLVEVELHLGGLHSRMIAASAAEVANAWAAAQAARVEPSPSPSPSPPPPPKPSPRPSPKPSPSPRPRR